MGLGDRINRVIKTNLNDISGNFNRTEGAMFLAVGGVAGAGISATVGNMGLAACGTAVGIYAGHVIAAGSVIGLSVYGLSRLLDSNEIDNSNIETLDRVKLSIQQTKERLESQCKHAENEAQVWHKIAKQVLEQGRQDLAVGALHRWNAYQQIVKSLKIQISELTKDASH
jgi:hypothetical protein